MKTYKPTNGQNIFDIAILLYGSIEGIYDLMISNEQLSMCSDLSDFEELNYHDDFVINSSVTNYITDNKLTPANGERSIYYKGNITTQNGSFGVTYNNTFSPLRCIIECNPEDDNVIIRVAGSNNMIVDFGDNSELQKIPISTELNYINHYFNNKVSYRQIRLYGDFVLTAFHCDILYTSFIPTSPIIIDEFTSRINKLDLSGLFLIKGVGTHDGCRKIDLRGSEISDLSPIVHLYLNELDLRNCKFNKDSLNQYLISIVKNSGTRTPGIIKLTDIPSGQYKQPMQEHGEYIISSGMEAVWLLTNDDSLNTDGNVWVIDINNTRYSYKNSVTNIE